tara:strand:- start:43 stop:777 length:735 start_codon:yes stop_codon:yes gene_type:complete
MSKKSSINLYDEIDGSFQFKLSQGQSVCDQVIPTVFHINAPAVKITSSGQVVNNIVASVLNNEVLVANEQTRASAAEVVLTQAVVDETSSRVTADATLQSNINVQKSRITQEIEDRLLDVSTEESRAITAETLLQTNLTTENGLRVAADNTEQATRIANDNTLQTNITNETTRSTDAETLLQNNIETEKQRINSILSLSSEDLDSFKEIATAYTNADSNLQTLITNLTTNFTALQAVVDTLTQN